MGGAGLTLIGCGGGTTAKPPTVSQACAAYAGKVGGDIQTCAPGLMSVFGYSVLADCVSAYALGCETAAAAPHTGYAGTRIQSCANEFAKNSCTEFLSLTYPKGCVPAGGTVADGGACGSDWECASTRCSAQLNQCGTCVARIARGAACDRGDDRCAVNVACVPAAVGSTSFVCTAVAVIGGSCTDGAVCPINSYCEPDTHLCTVLPKLGEACDPKTMFFCDLTSPATECDSAASTCVAGPTPVPVGTSCDAADHNLTTDTSCAGTCVGAGDGGFGICQPYGQAGEDCALGEICASGLA